MGGMPIPAKFVERLMNLKPGEVLRGPEVHIPLGDPPAGYHWEQVYPPTIRGAFFEAKAVPNDEH